MPILKTYNLFISHAWTYNKDYYRLIDYLKAHPNFRFRNYSVPEHAPLNTSSNRQLKEALRRQIGYSHIVIILAGMYATYRDWIIAEMDLANRLGKPIIAIKPWGKQRIPQIVRNYAKTIVNWNTRPIVNAIRRYSL